MPPRRRCCLIQTSTLFHGSLPSRAAKPKRELYQRSSTNRAVAYSTGLRRERLRADGLKNLVADRVTSGAVALGSSSLSCPAGIRGVVSARSWCAHTFSPCCRRTRRLIGYARALPCL